jgi:hypothetical protein
MQRSPSAAAIQAKAQLLEMILHESAPLAPPGMVGNRILGYNALTPGTRLRGQGQVLLSTTDLNSRRPPVRGNVPLAIKQIHSPAGAMALNGRSRETLPGLWRRQRIRIDVTGKI